MRSDRHNSPDASGIQLGGFCAGKLGSHYQLPRKAEWSPPSFPQPTDRGVTRGKKRLKETSQSEAVHRARSRSLWRDRSVLSSPTDPILSERRFMWRPQSTLNFNFPPGSLARKKKNMMPARTRHHKILPRIRNELSRVKPPPYIPPESPCLSVGDRTSTLVHPCKRTIHHVTLLLVPAPALFFPVFLPNDRNLGNQIKTYTLTVVSSPRAVVEYTWPWCLVSPPRNLIGQHAATLSHNANCVSLVLRLGRQSTLQGQQPMPITQRCDRWRVFLCLIQSPSLVVLK